MALKNASFAPLPTAHLEYVPAWGAASGDICYVFRPTTVEAIADLFGRARQSGCTVGFRGTGNSYGDAALNSENILIDLRRMNRILQFDPQTGLITVQPGVTLQQLWEYVIEDGWWPPIVTGTMKTSVGGCVSMNTHGKNVWQMGTFGNHLLQFNILLSSGEILTCSRQQNSDLFFAAVGGFGMLGCIISITLQLKRIYSGWLKVTAYVSRSLGQMIDQFHTLVERSDYTVGWVDGFAKGSHLGRGQIHTADYLTEGADPYPTQSLQIERQRPPEFFFKLLPANVMWLFMRPFWNNAGIWLVNHAKYLSSWWQDGHSFYQPHASFHFLLDYIPNWKKAYGSGGLIQYQSFIPTANAQAAFSELLQMGQRAGLPNYLGVLKRHRPDPFWMTHGLDGFSLAMDFRITQGNRAKVVALCRQMDKVVLQASGRFYFAKDSTLHPETVQAYLGEETIARFTALKKQCDPEQLIQTNLWRRLFGNS